MKKLNVIDLFSGAGGFSEGFTQTNNYRFLAHIEWEKPMVETLRMNLINRWGHTKDEALKSVIRFDIQKTDELINGKWSEETKKLYEKDNHQLVVNKGLRGLVGDEQIDIIIGGPPCQAYSLAGRAQDPNSMKDDYRNYLFESFVTVVNEFRPNIFVFENVPGMLSAKPGDRYVIERIYEAFNKIGYEIRKPSDLKKSVYSSADFKVPQERKRVIIIGVKKTSKLNLENFYKSLDLIKTKGQKMTVRDAIGDMPKYIPLNSSFKEGRRNISHKLIEDNPYTLHDARYHNKRDINVFFDWISNKMNSYSIMDKLDFYILEYIKRSKDIL